MIEITFPNKEIDDNTHPKKPYEYCLTAVCKYENAKASANALENATVVWRDTIVVLNKKSVLSGESSGLNITNSVVIYILIVSTFLERSEAITNITATNRFDIIVKYEFVFY
ncbi:hypothetical protein EIN_430240 [Entamoeba invadens IP1]|uniref:Uncharacterized protein n=1 Tax=Entamoeba invadens IP1 TaxID=370355 RepID=A0A0A1UFF6_ENTIV|nr:hypothetical protein EIN_430240 [Entamoeba invadens IP1]ELP95228.1 hypothetical protein EIN_430240 [Entamoeba invadens IP1]|eukprot:XP_004261999.1 hypothetical protein EIN_430240 [Entamoeba invadens IP1]